MVSSNYFDQITCDTSVILTFPHIAISNKRKDTPKNRVVGVSQPVGITPLSPIQAWFWMTKKKKEKILFTGNICAQPKAHSVGEFVWEGVPPPTGIEKFHEFICI